jgi:hypothetical protein
MCSGPHIFLPSAFLGLFAPVFTCNLFRCTLEYVSELELLKLCQLDFQNAGIVLDDQLIIKNGIRSDTTVLRSLCAGLSTLQ